MIVLLPDAGLCNRMRAIDSAIALSQEANNPLKIYWIKYEGMNCSFHDLFEPFPESVATVKELDRKPYHFYNPKNSRFKLAGSILRAWQQRYFDQTIFLEDFPRLIKAGYNFNNLILRQNLLIESHSRFFYPKQLPVYSYFKPLPAIQDKINTIISSFSAHTIGVHIRRSDHSISTENSPLELFIQVMKKELDFNAEASFFLASDSEAVKTELLQLFGDKIILANHGESRRDSKSGIIDAVVDLYALSSTKKVLGSYRSSFSHTASHISGIEEIVVSKNTLSSRYSI